MKDDLNISVALSVIDEMIAQTNEKLDANPKDKSLKKEAIANIELIDSLLGFGGEEPFSYFQAGVEESVKKEIESLLQKRIEAKQERDFATADAIRDRLLSMGISIMDTAEGTLWEKNT